MLDMDYEKELSKIEDMCIGNKLEFEFTKFSFPVVATIKPSRESKNQIRMDLGDGSKSLTAGEIKFIFGDELTMSIENDFMIEDQLLNRIKNAAKKLHYIYLQMYFKEQTKLTRNHKIGGYIND